MKHIGAIYQWAFNDLLYTGMWKKVAFMIRMHPYPYKLLWVFMRTSFLIHQYSTYYY